MSTERSLRIYDHRLVRLVQETGNARIATSMGGPRSSVAGWLKRVPETITTEPGVDSASEMELRSSPTGASRIAAAPSTK